VTTTAVSEELRDQARRLRLRWSCEVCANFDPEGQRCANGYPTAPHRAAALETQELVFCKEFELY
jgi:hypothetical protein